VLVEERLYKHLEPFELELGQVLPRFQIQYVTMGEMNADKSNVIWICHALTASARVDDWWDGIVGEGKLFDPSKHFIICANMLGSCYGSSSPLDTNPETHDLYLRDFPKYTTRDMAAVLIELRKHLGIEKVHTLVGASMGGQQALEWAILEADRFDNFILLASNAQHSPWGIAFNESQRMVIEADPTWSEHVPEAGKLGLRAARSVALLSYRHYEAYWNTQLDTDIEKTDHYKAQSYQQYQGDKLVERFNAHCYYFLSKAMDSHHVGRGRGGVERALKLIRANTLTIGIRSDMLFPPAEQERIARSVDGAKFVEIDSFYGHDGFLIETKLITEIITDFYKTKNQPIN
jgi:homoserine O-acetyltransferase